MVGDLLAFCETQKDNYGSHKHVVILAHYRFVLGLLTTLSQSTHNIHLHITPTNAWLENIPVCEENIQILGFAL